MDFNLGNFEVQKYVLNEVICSKIKKDEGEGEGGGRGEGEGGGRGEREGGSHLQCCFVWV